MLVTIQEKLQGTVSFDIGDSALDTRRQTWRDLFARMERLAALEEPWTLVIRCDTSALTLTPPYAEPVSAPVLGSMEHSFAILLPICTRTASL